jgi:mono/diheme cytochrome c family protein
MQVTKSRPAPVQSSCGRRVVAAALASAGLLAVAGPVGAQTKLDARAAAEGGTTYVRYCVSCHGPKGKGDGPLAKDLRVSVPDLTTLTARNGGKFPYDRVVRIITKGNEVRGHGSDDMPAWGTAFRRTEGTEAPVDEAIRKLAHYLWSLQPSK